MQRFILKLIVIIIPLSILFIIRLTASQNISDAYSYYLQAVEYASENHPVALSVSREFIQKALYLEPYNIAFRFYYAELLEKSGYIYSAEEQYKKIVQQDSFQTKAWYRLACFKENDFNDFNKSIKITDIANVIYTSFAEKDFQEAEYYFLKTLSGDSSHHGALMHLAFLYEDAAEYQKGMDIVNKLVTYYPQDKDALLYLALISYRCQKIEQAHLAFRQALTKMSIEEKQDFVVNSVNVLLERLWKDKDYSTDQIRMIKNHYWQMNDPLLLTGYNERLIEHYARVAYANLRFSVPEMDITGWESDRGKIFIKYGEPLNRTRLRPQIDEVGILSVKTDVWNYGDFTLGFSDDYASGNFRFSEPARGGSKSKSQFNSETQLIVDNLKSTQPERYIPVFEGSRINIANRLAQFKNPNHFTNEKTDIYLYYGMPAVDTVKSPMTAFNHQAGLFFFDSVNELKYQERRHVYRHQSQNNISITDSITLNIHAERMSLKPDSGSIAFEIIRDYDKGVSSNHGKLKIREFSRYDLDISDMILASKLDFEESKNMTISRNGISFIPNPSLVFKPHDAIYLYCEIYNLAKGADNFTDFEQVIAISRITESENKGILNFFKNITDWAGITKSGQQVTLRSSYQTDESDVPIYLQLDMSNYDPADYQVKLTIFDNNSGRVVSDKSILFLR